MTLDQLKDAVRGATSLEELKRMVGPSEEESEASKRRLAAMDELTNSCEWHLMTPSAKAQQARERYKRIEQEQAIFENTYC